MINGVNPLEHAPTQHHYFRKTFAFVEQHLFCRPPHDLQSIFDDFEHCTCHQDQRFSHRRREFLRCLLFESYVAANLQISFFYFFQNLRKLVELFLYERYPRSCLKILTKDPLQISSSPASFRTDTLFLRFIRFLTFWIIPLVVIMRGRPKVWDKLIVPISLTILHHRRMVRELTKPFKSSKIFVEGSPFSYL